MQHGVRGRMTKIYQSVFTLPTAVKLGPSWCMRLLTITSATSGCLQSAQLAQWAALTLTSTARCRLRESLGQRGGRTMRRWKSTRGAAQNKRSTRSGWNPQAAKSRVFGDCHIHLGSDEIVASDGSSEDFQAPYGWIQTGVTPPNHCLRVHNSHAIPLCVYRGGPGSERAPGFPLVSRRRQQPRKLKARGDRCHRRASAVLATNRRSET